MQKPENLLEFKGYRGKMIFYYLLIMLLGIQQDALGDLPKESLIESWFLEKHPKWGEDIFVYDRFQENLGEIEEEDWKKFVTIYEKKFPRSPLIPVVKLSRLFIDFKNGKMIDWEKIAEPPAQQFFTLLLQYHPEIPDKVLVGELQKYLISRPLRERSVPVLIKIFDHLQNKKQGDLYTNLPEEMGKNKEVIFRCAWLFYKIGRYSAAKTLFKWLERERIQEACFYLGAMEMRQYGYKRSAEYFYKYLTQKGKGSFRLLHGINISLVHQYYASALNLSGEEEKAYKFLTKIYKKTASLMYLYIRVSRKLRKKNVSALKKTYQKRFPQSVHTKRMKRTSALESLEGGNAQGLDLYEKIYPNHREDHKVLKFLMSGEEKTAEVFEFLRDPFYGYFIRQPKYTPQETFPKIYKGWIAADQKKIHEWISKGKEGLTISKLRKPVYVSKESVRKKILIQKSKFFDRYYEIKLDQQFLLRLEAFSKRGMEKIAKFDIQMYSGGSQAKELFYRQRLYEFGKNYRLASVEMSIKLQREKVLYDAPYKLLRKSFPVCYMKEVKKVAGYVGIEPEMIYAVMRAESFFDERAFSSAGAMGLMQLMTSTAKEIYSSKKFPKGYGWDLFNPELNILLGAIHLADLMKYFKGNFILSAAAYNVGRNVVDRWIKKEKEPIDWLKFCMLIKYEETYFYVQKVIRNYEMYQILYGEGIKKVE